MPQLSIVIPCYNSGQFLPEALASVSAYPDKSVYEVIVVDDGSTDATTLAVLAQLTAPEYTVIRQVNAGPAAARNAGVRAARSESIMFLDSDNKIRPAYIDKALVVLNSRPEVGVVYSRAAFFGTTGVVQFVPQEFDMLRILRSNYIDMCSVVRKKVWEEVGGLDESRLLIGHEDWEFWISIGTTDWQFAYLNEELFEYRVRPDSLTQQVGQGDKLSAMTAYVHAKHWPIFLNYYKYLERQLDYYTFDQQNPLRSFLKYTRNALSSPDRPKAKETFRWK